ncbi:MAG: hypothetical protein LWW86_07350 [Micrococcales bacterium]|nr:hypothetical protein [Micrococcales bacterium]
MLLPLVAADDTWTSWAGWDLRHHRVGVDGYTDFAALTELWPDDETIPPRTGGWGAPSVRSALERHCAAGLDTITWFREATWDETLNRCVLDPSDEPMVLPWRDYVGEVCTSGFRGLARLGQLSVESPPYPDSLLVTGPDDTLDWLLTLGLEAHEVTRAIPFGIWSD